MKRSIILIALLAQCIIAAAQKKDTVKKASSADSLLNSLSADDSKHQNVLSVFKATRLIFSPTTEMVKKKNLNFMIIHRFGDIGDGVDAFGKPVEHGFATFYGLDDVQDVYIGFEYGISNNFNVNFGRSTVGKLMEVQLKYAILHQTNDNSVPLAITLQGGAAVRPYGDTSINIYPTFADRLSYIAEAIISRRFTSALSLEVSPVFVRNNQPNPRVPENGNTVRDLFSLTAGGRLKVTKHMSILVDYEHTFSNYQPSPAEPQFQDPFGVGAEFETGGHVFTINFTNARAISQFNTLSNPNAVWGHGQYRFGFTISRMFDFNPKKGDDKKW